MKVHVYQDACPHWEVDRAEQDGEDVIDITAGEWAEFEEAEEARDRMVRLFAGRLSEQKRAAESEVMQLKARLAQLESRLGVKPAPVPKPAAPAKPHNPVDETDWGMGIGGREKPIDPTDFRAELADLRDRTTEKRARRGVA